MWSLSNDDYWSSKTTVVGTIKALEINTSQWWIWNHDQSQSSSFDLRSFLFQLFPYRHLQLRGCFCSSSLLPITSDVFVWAKIRGLSVTCWSHVGHMIISSDWWFQTIFRHVCLNGCNSHCRSDEDDWTLFQFNISSISVHEDTRSSSTSPNKHLLTKVNHFQFRWNNMQIFSSGDFSMGMFKTFIINNEKRKQGGWVSYAVL